VGKVLSSTFNNGVLTCSEGQSKLLLGLVKGLQNLKAGEKRKIALSAEQAYGFYDPDLVIKVSRKGIVQGETLQVGNQIITQANDGEFKVFRVVQASQRSVVLDGNHPLAGQDLVFEIEATDTRDATPEEIAASSFKIPFINFN
jgi:FKBP-type peptidyl-prolyl cis-trans isomerase SlyD